MKEINDKTLDDLCLALSSKIHNCIGDFLKDSLDTVAFPKGEAPQLVGNALVKTVAGYITSSVPSSHYDSLLEELKSHINLYLEREKENEASK